MKITISNIAWNVDEDDEIIKSLAKYHIKGVEIAPTKIWTEPTKVNNITIQNYKKYWNTNGIEITSTQAILFGHPELKIFDSEENRKKSIIYLDKMMKVTSLLGGKVVVFGSPKNRDANTLDKNSIKSIANEFFYTIGEIAKKHNIFFCIEPNPQIYGTNFINNSNQAIELVQLVNHPNFQLHLDTGAMAINKENFEESITNGFAYLKHFHISEENLNPIGDKSINHKKIAMILKKMNYNNWVSIEMRNISDKNNNTYVEKALQFVTEVYQ